MNFLTMKTMTFSLYFRHSCLALTGFLLPLLFCTSCKDMPEYGSIDEPSFRIVQDSVTIEVGESCRLSLSVDIAGVTWTSSADTVATVDYRGRVDALLPGVTVISATRIHTDGTASPSSECVVTVTNVQ